MPEIKSHTVDRTPDLEHAIRRRVESGAYTSDVEVFRAAILSLDREDAEKARRLMTLDTAIARGLADADAGRVHPAEQVFGELRRRIREKADAHAR